jgi:putative acetyltransferase
MDEFIVIKEAEADDFEALKNLFIDTVHTINAKDYTKEQILAWAPNSLTASEFKEKLKDSYLFKAEKKRCIVGFINLLPSGLIGYLYVDKNFINKKIATMLLKKAEQKAKDLVLTQISLEASITSYPFFKKRGFVEEIKQMKLHNGFYFQNYRMTKKIPP